MLRNLLSGPFMASKLSGKVLLGLTMSALASSPRAWASTGTSVRQGQYWFPPDAATHEATMLGFPSQNSLPRDQVNKFRSEIIDLAGAISEFEAVRLYTRPEETDAAQTMLDGLSLSNPNVAIIPFPVVHSWVRDTGPAYVFQKNETGANGPGPKRFAIDFNFNEWGGKAPVPGSPWGEGTPPLSKEELQDNAKFAQRAIAEDDSPSPVTRVTTGLTLEGGGLEVDGEGTLLITESSVVNDNRNPGMSKDEIYDQLRQLLGVTKILSVKGLRDMDITDCHIDAVARFVRPGVVIVSRPHINQGQAWVDVADEAIRVLGNNTDAKGRPFEVHVVNEPDPVAVLGPDGGEASLSYANYYQINDGVVVPAFGEEKADSAALDTFNKLYPDRGVVQVKIHAIGLGGGGIHCVTQQVPKPAAS